MKPLPKPIEYDITIPEGLPQLEGTLSRRARVEIALDVIATLKSRQRKLELQSTYFDPYGKLPKTGQLHTSRLPTCTVCARGILFLKTVDRFDQCEATGSAVAIESLVVNKTLEQWGRDQTYLIETAFEGVYINRGSLYFEATREFRLAHPVIDLNRKPLMIAICQNIVDNHGEFKP